MQTSIPARRTTNSPCTNRVFVEPSKASVSKREQVAILRQVREIRASWTELERQERAKLGRERQAELCRMLFA